MRSAVAKQSNHWTQKEQPRAKSMGNPLHPTGSNHVSVNRRFNGLMRQLKVRVQFLTWNIYT